MCNREVQGINLYGDGFPCILNDKKIVSEKQNIGIDKIKPKICNLILYHNSGKDS